MDELELQAWLRLSEVPGLGPVGARRLLAKAGGACAVFELPRSHWRGILAESEIQALHTLQPGWDERVQAVRAWLEGERGPDVSPDLTWYPVVTFLQLGLDMALSQTSPIGHGHVYAARDYIDSWVAVVDPPGWDTAHLDALKEALEPTDAAPRQP